MRAAAALLVAMALALTGCAGQPAAPDSPERRAAEVNAELGVRYMMQGNYEVAREKLERALTYDSGLYAAHHYLAELNRRTGRMEEADEHFRAALDLNRDDLALRNNYGVFLCDQGRYREAEEQFTKVAESPAYPAKARVYENLGLCLLRGAEREQAEHYLRKALTLQPKLAKSLAAMAELMYEQRDFLSARAYLQRYEAVAQHAPKTLWLAARTELALGDAARADDYAKLLRQRFPDSEETRLYLRSNP